jgi:hypothetical protein
VFPESPAAPPALADEPSSDPEHPNAAQAPAMIRAKPSGSLSPFPLNRTEIDMAWAYRVLRSDAV